MPTNEIATRSGKSGKEIAQYSVSFGLFAVVLYVIGFPIFWLVVLATVSLFLWRALLTEARRETRPIFEFLLSANAILRENQRVWYGFEIKETIEKGERITKLFSTPPPLVEFALGALYQRIGDDAAAIRYLEGVMADGAKRELSIVYPAPELREYVRFLRKIEDSPAEAPITAAAIRSLERMRRLKGEQMLAASQSMAAHSEDEEENRLIHGDSEAEFSDREPAVRANSTGSWRESPKAATDERSKDEPTLTNPKREEDVKVAGTDKNSRKTISEVLHDIYDTNVN